MWSGHGIIIAFYCRYLIPNCSLRLVFWRGRPQFHLISNDPAPDYELEIVRAYLQLHYIEAVDGLTQSVNELLGGATAAKYFLEFSKLKSLTLSAGDGSCSITDVYSSGSLPTELLLILNKQTSFAGSWVSNPFEFVHAKISSILTLINDEPCPYATPILIQADKGLVAEIYNNLFVKNPYGVHGEEIAKTLVTKDDFIGGTSIFRIVFSHTDINLLQPLPRQGKLSLEITFSQGLSVAHTLVLYAKFPAILEVASSGQINLRV